MQGAVFGGALAATNWMGVNGRVVTDGEVAFTAVDK